MSDGRPRVVPAPLHGFLQGLVGYSCDNWSVHTEGTRLIVIMDLVEDEEAVEQDLSVPQQSVSDLQAEAAAIQPALSQHDNQLIQDHIATLESRLQKSIDEVASKLDSCQNTQEQLDKIQAQLSEQESWLETTVPTLQTSLDMSDPSECQAHYQTLADDLTLHGVDIERLQHQGAALLPLLGDADRHALELRLKQASARVMQLREETDAGKKELTKALSNHEALQIDVKHVQDWVDAKQAEKPPTMALKPAELAKQLEALKRALTAIKMFGGTVNHLMNDGEKLSSQYPALQDTLQGLQQDYDAIRDAAELRVSTWTDSLAKAKALEADLSKLEHWLTEANKITDQEPKVVDVQLEKLQSNLTKVQNIGSNIGSYEELLNDMNENKEALMKELSPADQALLSDRLSACKENINRVSSECVRHTSILGEAVSSREEMEEDMAQLTSVLLDAQKQLRPMVRGIGATQEDVNNMAQQLQSVQDELADCEPRVARLSHDQDTNTDVARILDNFQQTVQQVSDQKQKVEKAAKLRDRFYANKAELEMQLKQCEEQLEAVDVVGVPVPTKLDRYKAVVDSLSGVESQLAQLENEAQQIMIEAGPTAKTSQQVSTLAEDARELKSRAQEKLSKLESVVSERAAFQKELDGTLQWLGQLEKKPLPGEGAGGMNLSLDSVEHELEQLEGGIGRQLETRLGPITEQMQRQREAYQNLDENVPLELQDKMEQIEALAKTMQDKIACEREKLKDGERQRQEYYGKYQEVLDWVNKAQTHLKNTGHDLNYDELPQQLQEHQDLFANTSDVNETMDAVLDLAEKLGPTLDINDRETLKQTVSNLNSKLTATTANAEQQEQQLIAMGEAYTRYKEDLKSFNETLAKLESASSDTPKVHNLADAKSQLQLQENLSKYKPEYMELMELSDSLLAFPGVKDQDVTVQKTNLNTRWMNLNKQHEEKCQALQDTMSVWEAYESQLSTMQHLLEDCQHDLPPEDLATQASVPDLEHDLEKAVGTSQRLEGEIGGKMAALQKSCHQLLALLPQGSDAGPAKALLQQNMTAVQDKYQQLQWQSSDSKKMLEDELAERGEVTGQLEEVRRWLQDTSASLQSSPRSLDDLEQHTVKHKELKEQLGAKMALLQGMMDDKGDNIPPELVTLMHTIQQEQDSLSEQLSGQEEQLSKAMEAQSNYSKAEQDVATWLDNTETQLADITPTTIQAGQQHSEDLMEELHFFEAKIARMRLEAEQVASVSTPEVDDQMQQTIGRLEARFRQVQHTAEQRRMQLAEAAETQQAVEAMCAQMTEWSREAEGMCAAGNTDLASAEKVRARVDEQKALLCTGEALPSRLDELLGQLSPVDISSMPGVQEARERYRAAHEELSDHTAQMAQAAGTWETLQDETQQVIEWLQGVKATQSTEQTAHAIAELERVLSEQAKLQNVPGYQEDATTKKLREELEALKQQQQQQQQKEEEERQQQQQYLEQQQQQLELEEKEREVKVEKELLLAQQARDAQDLADEEVAVAEQMKKELEEQKAEIARIKDKLEEIESKSQEDYELRSQEELESKSQEELQAKSQEEFDSMSQEEFESKSQEELQAKSQEEFQAKSQEELDSMSQKEFESKSQEELQAKSQEELEPKSQEDLEMKSQEDLESKSQEELHAKSQEELDSKSQEELEWKSQLELESKPQEDLKPRSQEELESKSQEELQAKSQEELDSMSQEEFESKSQEEFEPKSREELEPKSREELEPKSLEELGSKSQDDLDSMSQEEFESKSQEELQAKSQEEFDSMSQSELEPKSQDELEGPYDPCYTPEESTGVEDVILEESKDDLNDVPSEIGPREDVDDVQEHGAGQEREVYIPTLSLPLDESIEIDDTEEDEDQVHDDLKDYSDPFASPDSVDFEKLPDYMKDFEDGMEVEADKDSDVRGLIGMEGDGSLESPRDRYGDDILGLSDSDAGLGESAYHTGSLSSVDTDTLLMQASMVTMDDTLLAEVNDDMADKITTDNRDNEDLQPNYNEDIADDAMLNITAEDDAMGDNLDNTVETLGEVESATGDTLDNTVETLGEVESVVSDSTTVLMENLTESIQQTLAITSMSSGNEEDDGMALGASSSPRVHEDPTQHPEDAKDVRPKESKPERELPASSKKGRNKRKRRRKKKGGGKVDLSVKSNEDEEEEDLPERRSEERTPERRSQEKTPKRRSQERTPERRSPEKTPERSQEKTPERSQEKTPERRSQERTSERRSQERTTERRSRERTPDEVKAQLRSVLDANKQREIQLKVHDLTQKLEALDAEADNLKIGEEAKNAGDLTSDAKKLEDALAEVDSLEAMIEELEKQRGATDDDEGLNQLLAKLKEKHALAKEKLQTQKENIQVELSKREKQHEADVGEYDAWMTEAQRGMHDPVLGLDTQHLTQELEDNKSAQAALDARLARLDALEAAGEDVGDSCWSRGRADSERERLRKLREATLLMKEKLQQQEKDIEQALQNSSTTEQDIDQCNRSADDLKKWMKDSSEMEQKVPNTYNEEQNKLQQALSSEVTEHQRVMQSVCAQAEELLQQSGKLQQQQPAQYSMDSQWRNVARQLSEKTKHLQQAIDANQVGWMPSGAVSFPTLPATSEHLALGDIDAAVRELQNCWRTAQGQMSDRDRHLSHLLQFQHLYHSALLTISQWLDVAEGKLFDAPTYGRDSEEVLQECADIQDDMETVHAQLDALNALCQALKAETSAENGRMIEQAVTQLADRVGLLENQATQRHLELVEEQRRKRDAEAAVENLQGRLQDARDKLEDLEAGQTVPVEEQAKQVQQLQRVLGQCDENLYELGNQRSFNIGALSNECQQLQHQADIAKSDLGRALGLAGHYEKMLEEFTEYLETAQAKLKNEGLSAADLPHFKTQIKAHNDFFQDLTSHRGVLDTLVEEVDPVTVESFRQAHDRLNNLTQILEDKAGIRSSKMAALHADWEELEEQLADLKAWFSRMKRSLPERANASDSIEQLRHKIWEYASVERALGEEKPEMQQIVARGRRLLQAVSCPALEADINQLADHWIQITSDTNTETKRLENIVDQWEKFESDAGTLESWLRDAQGRMQVIGEEGDVRSLPVIQSKMQALVELRQDADKQQATKTKVNSIGAQLLRLRPHDASIQARIDTIDQQWINLMYKLPNNEDRLHAAQMELLPSRQAVHELTGWLDNLEKQLKQDLATLPCPAMLDTQVMLHKYKGIKIELSQKQLTVDFVNESVADTSMEGTDHTDFAERLGTMNSRFERVSSDVLEMVKKLDLLALQWEEYDKTVHSIANWLDGENNKLERYAQLGHEVSITQALEDLKALEKQLNDKQRQIEQIGRMGRMLAGSSEPSEDELHHAWIKVQEQLSRSKASLQQKQHQWSIFRQVRDRVSKLCNKVEHSLVGFHRVSGDLIEFDQRIGVLEQMGNDMKVSEQDLNMLLSCGQVLQGSCGPTVAKWLGSNMKQHEQRYLHLQAKVADQTAKHNALQQEWATYDQMFQDCDQDVVDMERQAKLLLRSSKSPEEQVKATRELQRQVNASCGMLNDLSRCSSPLMPSLDQPTIIQITAKETRLSERVNQLQKQLAHHLEQVQGLCARQVQFSTTRLALESFLQDADSILSSDDEASGDMRERREQLKALHASFAPKQGLLDKVNEMGFKLALNEEDSKQLAELNEKWHSLEGACRQRQVGIQQTVLRQDDFRAKCEDWLNFLDQVQEDLAREPSAEYDHMLKQKQDLDALQYDLHSRQPVLSAILSEGHDLLGALRGYDASDFQDKLLVLDDQWKTVLKRVNQKSASVNQALGVWDRFMKQKEEMASRLEQLERQAADVTVDQKVPLQKLHQQAQSIQDVQAGLARLGPLQRQLADTAATLDAACRTSVAPEVTALGQQKARDQESAAEKLQAVEDVLRQWRHLEAGMEQLLDWLKDARRQLGRPMPLTIEEVQRALEECQDMSEEFQENSGQKADFERELSLLAAHIAPQDMSVLQQRHSLLSIQWDEIHNQLELRQQRLNDQLHQWGAFSDKYNKLTDWLKQTEGRLDTMRDYQIEDVISRMQNNFAEEMSQIAREKETLMQRGRDLIAVSNELHAHDIEYKLDRLQAQWQHVHDLLASRLRKLRQTLAAVHKLESSMAKLRGWLAGVEHQLSMPPSYKTADVDEIQRQLTWQQEVQRDIEAHSSAVASVLNLCEILLHDTDACPGSGESLAIANAKDTLNTRWHNICALATERRLRIEETGKLWQSFDSDHERLIEWMADCERQAKFPNTEANFAVIKQEMGLYQSFKERLHRSLSQLEYLNKQYRRLAREGRTDDQGSIKKKVEDANHRWDELSRRTAAIIRRLQHVSNVSTDFDATRQALLVWLSDLDMRMTTLESRRGGASRDPAALAQIQDDLETNQHRLEYIDKAAAYLMQKCEPSDCVQIQKDVEHFKKRCGEVIGHLNRLQKGDKPKSRKAIIGLKTQEWEDAEEASSSGEYHSEEEEEEQYYLPERDQPDGQEPALRHHGKVADANVQQLEHALLYAAEKLSQAEDEAGKTGGKDRPQRRQHKMTGLLAGCQASVEAVSDLTSQVSPSRLPPSLSVQIQGLRQRWQQLQATLLRSPTPRTSPQDARQLRDDLDKLRSWLAEAEAVQATQSNVPEDIWLLEQAVRRHREFLVQVESRKPTVLALNLAAKDLPTHDNTQGDIDAVTQRWDRVCAMAGVWQKELQIALLHSSEFRDTLSQLRAWLKATESQIRQLEPVHLTAPRANLVEKYNKFREYKLELERAGPKITSLEETANHLLVKSAGAAEAEEDAATSRACLASITRRLNTLLKVCHNYLADIERVVGVQAEYTAATPLLTKSDVTEEEEQEGAAAAILYPWQRYQNGGDPAAVVVASDDAAAAVVVDTDDDDDEESDNISSLGFSRRVFRAALPIQALMVLLLGAASLVPMTEEDFSCILANNFRQSLDPMLQYLDGPPPF